MKYLLLFLLPFQLFAQDSADVLIQHGKIINGTGNSWFYGDVAIANGTIKAIGNLGAMPARTIIDATGLIVAPGFIDVHTHIEDDEVKNPLASNFIYDGVTTVVTGNCGLSKVDLHAYFKMIDSLHVSINIASLIGHNDVRKAVMGTENRAPDAAELQRMKDTVDKAMRDGAVGFSTGLIYIPGTYSKTPEILALTGVIKKYNGVYATHMRDEADSVTEAIDEALTIGKTVGVPVEISHFKLAGQQNWGRSTQTLAMVQKAREQGLDVTIDQYPYTASSTSLSTLLPEAVLANGQTALNAQLAQSAIHKQVIDYMMKKLQKRKLKHYSYAVVASYKTDSSYNGKSIEEINTGLHRKHTAQDEAELILQMMQQGGASMVFHGMSEEDIQHIMRCPFNMFISDAGIKVFGEGAPHPRGYGTNARILGKYVREEKVITLEDAIRRMTSLPAQKFHLKNRGLLLQGYAGDVVVFDENTVKDLSTFSNPHQYSTGFKYVLVNGAITLQNGVHTGLRNGQVLYGIGMQQQ